MVTCQSSELGWEVTVELPTDFLSLGRGSIICEGVGEDSGHGIGHVDIRVGS